MQYVAFLRAVNVGGRVIKMAELKACLDKTGLKDVKTFIASGNVLFNAGSGETSKLTDSIERAIKQTFSMEVRVLIRNRAEMDRLTMAIPDNWVNDNNMKCDVMLLWPEIDNPKILKQLPADPAIEDIRYVEGTVIWRIDREKTPKSKMYKLVGSKLHKSMTVRNPNTIRKINALMAFD